MGDVLGRLWMVFLWVPWGGRGWGRENARALVTGSFFDGRHVFKQTRAMLKFRQLDDPFHTLKTMKDLLHLVCMVSYEHTVYVICYFWYMLFNVHLCYALHTTANWWCDLGHSSAHSQSCVGGWESGC